MIVSEVMTTKLVLVETGDTLGHAANLLRQHQFHHLPVAQVPRKPPFLWLPGTIFDTTAHEQAALPLLVGLLTSSDIDIAVALDTQNVGNSERRPWQDRRVAEVMNPTPLSINPTTSLATAAQLLVERGINCLPVVEYIETEKGDQSSEVSRGTKAVLVGLLTRSDLLMALARTMGAFQPGIELHLPLPDGDTTPLARMLMLANDLHIHISSVIAGPTEGVAPTRAIVRIGTINPAPLLSRLREASIQYSSADTPLEGNIHI